MLVIAGDAEEAGARTEQSEEAEFEAIQSNGLSVMLLLLLRLQSGDGWSVQACFEVILLPKLRRLKRARVLRSCIAA